ncbi:MAG: copper amine oxidase N-terminal domain-containing protein [Firmicutes bacterium]|nr:copper amine oxidase N-terminal domain-containing protein [Bacillota bacterium]
MKRMLKALALTLVLVLVLSTAATAAGPPTIVINGKTMKTSDPTVIENGRTMVPLRAIFSELGQPVNWNPADRSITSGNIWLQVNNQTAYVGDTEITLDVPAKIINGRTYVPLRFIADSLGKNVKWVPESNRVEITEKAVKLPLSIALETPLEGSFEGNTLVVKFGLKNIGRGYISKVKSVKLEVDRENGIEVATKTFYDIPLNIAPGEKKVVTVRFENVTPFNVNIIGIHDYNSFVLE